MKKIFFTTFISSALLFYSTYAFAFSDVKTHPKITEKAAELSILGCNESTYLKDYLGYINGLDTVADSDRTIRTILMDGARMEDTGTLPPPFFMCTRGYNHFYDPLTQKGLDEWTNLASLDIKILLPAVSYLTPIHWQGNAANYFWAVGDYDATTDIKDEPSPSAQKSKEANEYSWKRAREAFIAALTSKPEEERNRLFARTFRSVGQVAHLLQDMAVPAHVRNDMKGHLYYQKYLMQYVGGGFIDWMGNNFEAYVAGPGASFIKSDEKVVSFNYLRDYWDEGIYEMSRNIDNTGLGLSEYTSANFLSSHKMLNSNSYPHPSSNDGSVVLDNVPSEDGKTDTARYFKMEKGEAKVNHLAHSSILGKYGVHFFDNLDDVCHADYAAKLVPKAVDYSKGLINYFFRGTLEIERPERYVYSIADGSVVPQQFTYIKAKVRNSTDYNGDYNGGGDSPMGPGKLWAVAKYKKRTNYDPNLATDPPTAGDREGHFSYSVSSPINGVTLSNTEQQEFNFNFLNDTIPAGITDLYLQVVYQGTLGNELETAVAVGMKDLSEPTHFVINNATDYMFILDYHSTNLGGNIFSTAEDIEKGGELPTHCRKNEEDNITECTDVEDCDGGSTTQPRCVYPFDAQVDIEFSPYIPKTDALIPHVTYGPLPAGRHGRVIFLRDTVTRLSAFIDVKRKQDEFPFENNSPCTYCALRFFDFIPLIVSQDNATTGVFEPAPEIAHFRGVNMHQGDFFHNWHEYQFSLPCLAAWSDNGRDDDALRACNYAFFYDEVYPSWPRMEDNETVEIGVENIHP